MKRPRSELEPEHTPEAIRRSLQGGPGRSFVRDFVYGAIDGAVTTFAVASGVAGAQLAPEVVVVLGVANLVADGFSMAASNYLGARSELQEWQRIRRAEEHHIDVIPEGEREEIRQIYALKGFEGADLERVVEVITADREQWIQTMLQEEHGLGLAEPEPVKQGLATLVAFWIAGAVPLVTFMVDLVAPGTIAEPYAWSAFFTALAFLAIGLLKGRVVGQPLARSAVETLLVGGAAAVLAYVIGALLGGLVA